MTNNEFLDACRAAFLLHVAASDAALAQDMEAFRIAESAAHRFDQQIRQHVNRREQDEFESLFPVRVPF